MSNVRNFNFCYLEDDKNKKTLNFNWNKDDLIEEPIKTFVKKINSQEKDLAFYFNGTLLNYEDKIHVKDKFSGSDTVNIVAFPLKKKEPSSTSQNTEDPQSKKSISISVTQDSNQVNEPKNIPEVEPQKKVEEKKEIEFYNDIICPSCKTSAIIENDGMKLRIINCENFHHIKNIRYDKFDDYEYDFDDISEENLNKLSETPFMQCDTCHDHIARLTPPRQLYICTCHSKMCPECQKTHNVKDHYKVAVENKNYKCLIHGKNFTAYCLDCNMNICESCVSLHPDANHEVIRFHNLKPKDNYIEEIKAEIDSQKAILDNFYENSKKILENVYKYLNKYIIIEKTFLNRYKKNEINFQLLQNIRNRSIFFDNTIFQDLNKFNDEQKEDKKLNSLKMILEKMKNVYKKEEEKPISNQKNNGSTNQLTIKYKINNPDAINRNIKIFDPIFVENNKNKCEIEIEYIDTNDENKSKKSKDKQLREYFNNNTKSNELKITLWEKYVGNNNAENQLITDFGYMFNNCKSFSSVDLSKWTQGNNITNIESMFQLTNISELPDISKFITTNLTNMRGLFCKCTNLKTINKNGLTFGNNTQNVKDMSLLFNGCRNLTKIDKNTNIGNWDVRKVEDMSYMFSRCEKVTDIHGIGSWKTNSLKNACGMFNKCEALTTLASIGTWNMENVTDISIIFQFCENLEKWPDLNKWNLTNARDISGVFSGCTKFKTPYLKYIKNWQLKNVTSMCGLFNECSGLTNFPDMWNNWSTDNVTDMSGLFCGCSSLTNLPPCMKNWKIPKVTDLSYIFDGCQELKNLDAIRHWDVKNVKNKTDALRATTGLPENVKEKWK